MKMILLVIRLVVRLVMITPVVVLEKLENKNLKS